MTKKWSRQIVFLGTFAFMLFLLPFVGWAAEKKSANEATIGAPQRDDASDSEIEQRLEQIDSDIEQLLGEQDKIKEVLKRNRLLWSGSLRVTCNNFHLRDKSPQLVPAVLYDSNGTFIKQFYPNLNVDKSYGSAWVSRLRLTMEYEITDTLRFYGQIMGMKYLNLQKSNPYLLDMEVTRYPLDAALRLERAFFEWWPVNWFGISAGRVSSPEGPPAELKENGPRNATWGVQMVEADMEGIGFFLKWSDYDMFRFAYLPYANFADARINNDINLFSNDGYKEFHAFALLLEMRLPYIGKNVFQLGSVIVPEFGPRNNAIFIYGPNEPIFPEPLKNVTNLGLYSNINTIFELLNIGGTGLDLFGAYSIVILKPTKQRERYKLYLKPLDKYIQNPDGTIVFTGETDDTTAGQEYPIDIGLSSYRDEIWKPDNPGGYHHGHFVYVGFRYSPPESLWSFFRDYPLRVGFEYNMATKYYFTWSSPSDLLINKYGVKGNVYEAYIIQQLVPNHMFARIGYVFIERKYDGVYLGPTRKVNQLIHNAYALLDVSW